MARMRILEIGKSTAGIGTYLRWLAEGLDRESFHLTFACLSERSGELAEELGSLKDTKAISWPMNRFKVDIFSDLHLIFRIAMLIRSEKFDLVHAHGSKAGFLSRLAAIGSDVPVIYSPHCFSFHDGVNPLSANLLAILERFAAKYLTARIITVADGEQKLALRYQVGFPKLFETVHTGIDSTPYEKPFDKSRIRIFLNLSENRPLVGGIGRLGIQKAPLDFVQMAALVHIQMPQTHFVWAGTGPLEEPVRKLIEELGIAEVCHFIGEYKDIPSLLGAMDCFVLPSIWEGFPIVLLEAMAAGVPVVATNIPGNDEAVSSGVNGWLVSPKEPFALAEKVLCLLNDRQQASEFVHLSRIRIQQEFTRASMLGSIQGIYQDVGNEKKDK